MIIDNAVCLLSLKLTMPVDVLFKMKVIADMYTNAASEEQIFYVSQTEIMSASSGEIPTTFTLKCMTEVFP